MLYFDVNATAPPHPEAEKVYRDMQAHYWQNPSSPYAAGARAHLMLDQAREDLSKLLGCEPATLVFNSGATEGNHSLFAWLRENSGMDRVAISAIEHPCVLESAKRFFPNGTTLLPVDDNGVVQLEALKNELRQGDLAAVSIMAANNETGALQPWREAREMCLRYDVLFHSDAAQWLGKKPAEGLTQCDFVTGCAHKFGGPHGVGFLKAPLESGFIGLSGGGQELGRRSGTENLAAIAAMVAALKIRETDLAQSDSEWAFHRNAFEETLKAKLPGLRILSENTPRLSNTSCLVMPEQKGVRWVSRMDKRGACLSTGSACASTKKVGSHVLASMGLSPEESRRSLRVSAPWEATAEDWQQLAALFIETAESFRRDEDADGNAEVIKL